MKLFLQLIQSNPEIAASLPDFNGYIQALSGKVFLAILLFFGVILFAFLMYYAMCACLVAFNSLFNSNLHEKSEEDQIKALSHNI